MNNSRRAATAAAGARAATRGVVVAVAALMTLGVMASSASAKPAEPGPGNSPNAKQCQKGGWEGLVRSDGTDFASEEECVAYAAQGGVLLDAAVVEDCLDGGWENVVRSEDGSSFASESECRTYAAQGGSLQIKTPAAVELQKINSGPAIPGSSFDYTIAVGNVGDCTLTNVRVNDVMAGPAGSTIVSTRPAGATVTPAAAPALFNIAFPDVGPIAPDGRVTLTIRVQVPANAPIGARYDNHVTVAANCDGSSATREFTLAQPAVEPRGTGPCAINGSTKSTSHIEVDQGEQFTYFVNLFNHGGEPCTGTTITDALDPRTTFVSCSDCTANGRTLTLAVGTLAPGQSITFPIIVQVNFDATGTLPNTARADTNETGPVDLTTPGPNVTGRSILAGNDPAMTPSGPR